MSSSTPTAVDALFSKSLSTMVKGIRNSRDKEQSDYIAKCLTEIKKELLSPDNDDKTEALKKLVYLQLLGYDMSWAAFHIVEVMSCNWFGHKREGYLAASLSFNDKTDVSLLTTNLFQKAFQHNIMSTNPEILESQQYEVGAALSCFSSIVTPALANDLLHDVLTLTNSSKPYIRRKAILAMYKIFINYPQALKIAFERLIEKLHDDNQSVVSAMVYILCELASISPKSYLGLAPQFYNILTSSSNNWILIKIVKLLGLLVPYEPRLAKKLQEPLVDIINTTPAKSLMYECINTLLCGQITSKSIVKLCLSRLRDFVESSDQNLKYLGLLGLHKLIQIFPRVVVEHKDLILACLNDSDTTIKIRALDLVGHLVTQRNLPGVIRHLLEHLHNSEGNYRDQVLTKILALCSQDGYAYVADFEWYLSCLIDFTRIPGASLQNAKLISDQIIDLMIRVPELRPFGTSLLCDVIIERRLFKDVSANANLQIANTSTSTGTSGTMSACSQVQGHNYMCEVLTACAFCVGEYAQYTHSHVTLLSCLLLHPNIPLLSETTQSAFAEAACKILHYALQQPYFNTAKEAKAWEEAQKAKVLEAKARAAEIRAQGVLPPEVEDPYALNDHDDDEEDSDDEHGSGQLKGGQLGLSGVGHAVYVGRTVTQHITFIEQLFTVVLTGLHKLSKSYFAQVQERAHIYYKYTQWVVSKFTGVIRINPELLTDGTSKPATNAPSNTASGSSSSSSSSDKTGEGAALDTAQLSSPSNIYTTDPITNTASSTNTTTTTTNTNSNSAVIDLTELLFGNDHTDISAFDPLLYLNMPSTTSSTISTSNPNDFPDMLLRNTDDSSITNPNDVLSSKNNNTNNGQQDTAPETTEDAEEDASASAVSEEVLVAFTELPMYYKFLITEPLVPVNAKAQANVPLPNGLDLEAEIYPDEDIEDVSFFTAETHPLFPIQVPKKRLDKSSSSSDAYQSETSSTYTESKSFYDADEDIAAGKARLQERMKAKKQDPYYLGGGSSSSSSKTQGKKSGSDKSKNVSIDLDIKDVGKRSSRMKVLGADGSDEEPEESSDDDIFEGSSLAVASNKKKKASGKDKEKDSGKSKEKDAATSKKKSKKAAQGQQPAVETGVSSVSEPLPLGIITLHSDAALDIYVQTKPVGIIDGKPTLLIALTFESKTSTIPMLQVSFKGNKRSTPMIPSVKQPSQYTHCITNNNITALQVKNITTDKRILGYVGAEWVDANISSSSLKFPVNIKYVENGQPIEVNTELVLPTSVFISPYKLTMGEFEAILTDPNTTCKYTSSHTIQTSNVMNTLRSIENALHVLLVEAVNRGAGYYGECITFAQNDRHVCVYAKSVDNAVTVTIKTANQTLSDKLAKDLERLAV